MTAIVTGAAGGIGAAVVRGLVAAGHPVIAQDLDTSPLVGVAGVAERIDGDLLDPATTDALTAAALDHAVDRVVAAHGIDGSAALSDAGPDFVARVLAVNTETVLALFAAVKSALSARDGTFVVVSSQAGLVGEPDNVAYSASKFALVGWARGLRRSGEEVRVRVLAPGCTQTPLFAGAQVRFAALAGVSTEEFLERRRGRIPVGRFATVEQTAAGALFLADPGRDTPLVLAATGGEVRH